MEKYNVVWRSNNYTQHQDGQVAGSIVQNKNKHVRYRVISVPWVKSNVLAHHIAWVLYFLNWPENIVDHKDGDGLNNAIHNLRLVTSSQNMMNRRANTKSKLKIKNVSYACDGRKKPYHAEVKKDGVHVLNKYFYTLDEAKDAAKKARLEHHMEYARHT
jgi:hypothetical protein